MAGLLCIIMLFSGCTHSSDDTNNTSHAKENMDSTDLSFISTDDAPMQPPILRYSQRELLPSSVDWITTEDDTIERLQDFRKEINSIEAPDGALILSLDSKSPLLSAEITFYQHNPNTPADALYGEPDLVEDCLNSPLCYVEVGNHQSTITINSHKLEDGEYFIGLMLEYPVPDSLADQQFSNLISWALFLENSH